MAHIIKDSIAYPLIVQQPSAPVGESFEYLTDLMTAVDGSESRVPLRQVARVEYEYTYPVDYKRDPGLYNMFYGALRKKFYVPVWQQAVKLSSDALSGSTDISIDIDVKKIDIRTGDYVLLWTSEKRWFVIEDVQVGFVSEETGYTPLTFANALTETFDSSNTWVFPVRLAYVTANVQKKTSGLYSEWSMSFEVLDELDVPDVAPVANYNGDDLYLEDVETDGEYVNTSFNTSIDRLDFSIGKFYKRTQWKNTRTSVNHNFMMESIDEVYALKKRFRRHYGRNRGFYTSSRSVNIRIESITSTTTAKIYSDDYGYYQQHKLAVFYLMDGTYLIRKIESVAAIDSEHIAMTFDGSIPQNLGDIYYVAYLSWCRLDSDTLEIKYNNNGVSSASFRVLELSPSK